MIHRNLHKLGPVQDLCGTIYELTTAQDNPSINFSMILVLRPTTPHVHHILTEIYYLEQGSGLIMVGDEVSVLAPGSAVLVPRYQPHCFIPFVSSRLLVAAQPSWFAADQYEWDSLVPQAEREILIDRLLAQRGLGLREDEDLSEQRSLLRSSEGWESMTVEQLREQLQNWSA